MKCNYVIWFNNFLLNKEFNQILLNSINKYFFKNNNKMLKCKQMIHKNKKIIVYAFKNHNKI